MQETNAILNSGHIGSGAGSGSTDRYDPSCRIVIAWFRANPTAPLGGSAHPPIRRIFRFQPLKGLTILRVLGLFVTTSYQSEGGGSLCWKAHGENCGIRFVHRSDRSRRRPTRLVRALLFHLSREILLLEGTKVPRTVKGTVRAARLDFNRVKSIHDIIEIFRERSMMKFRRFSLENYVQTHIAWGLGLIAIGQAQEGEIHLQKYCTSFSIDRNDRILRAAEAAARMLAPK